MPTDNAQNETKRQRKRYRNAQERMEYLEAKIKTLEEKAEQEKAKARQAKAKINAEKRKIDTRNKIIFGGWLLALLKEHRNDSIENENGELIDFTAYFEQMSKNPLPEALKAWIKEQLIS